MPNTSLFTPLKPFAPQAERGVVANGAARLLDMLSWPSRALETRRERALFAELSEAEQREAIAIRDHAFGVEDHGETVEDRAQRARAVRAWYGAKAA